MLDFGSTEATLGNLTNSPYHTAAGPSFTGAKWNTITADAPSGLVFSDNSAATGVSVNMGVSSGTTTTINLGSNTFSQLAGTASDSLIYAGNSVGRDGIFTSNSSNPYFGVQIGGLSAGTYDIYIAARNTNTGSGQAAYDQIAYVGKASTAANFSFTGYTSSLLSYAADQNPDTYRASAWVQGDNYVKLSITLTAGEYLNLAVAGNGTTRGFLNAMQIVSTSTIPEPSTYAALGGFAVLGLAVVARRRRGAA
ncbi:MAG: glycosyltransferase family 1 [Rariglobus sp.]|nr:glycosyltransferase family 1 [Rariglobus sp.]